MNRMRWLGNFDARETTFSLYVRRHYADHDRERLIEGYPKAQGGLINAASRQVLIERGFRGIYERADLPAKQEVAP